MEEQEQRILDHPVTKPLIFGVVGFLGGVAVGYLLGQRSRRTTPPPQEELEKIERAVTELKARRAEARKPIVEEVIVVKPEERDEPDIVIERLEDTDWDYEEEKQNRDSLEPYVIHKDEFWSNEMDFAQHTWTYYEGDDVMVNEEDIVVYNHDQKVGDLKFGHGSGDPNTVYIRNEKMKMEMEVLREEGLYSIEVMGMQVDTGEDKNVEHSNTRKNKRSRYDE